MGIDFQYASSINGSRFYDEITSLAGLFGGKRVKTSRDSMKNPAFLFSEGTDKTLMAWFNAPDQDLTEEETERVWELISQRPEAKSVSGQIWHELESLVELGQGWHIF